MSTRPRAAHKKRRPDAPARRRKALLRALRSERMDGMLITAPSNVGYLTGFTGDDSALLLARDTAALLTDARYTTQAAQEMAGVDVLCRKAGMMAFAAKHAGRLGIARLGFEAASLPVAEHGRLEQALKSTELVSTKGLVEELRLTKDRDELARIRTAVRVAEEAFTEIRPLVRPGVTEKALAAALEGAMLRLGAEAASFRPIVLAQERAALPHGRPSERALAEGEAVLFDWGAVCEGYVSDLTRVLFVHRIMGCQKSVYTAVLTAQTAAIRRVRPGRPLADLDRTARAALAQRRRGKYFTHSLGHGVGADVHEAPTVSSKSKQVCRAGMVFTVEPGVYYPDRIGIRIEDMVVVTRKGHQILTTLPKRPDDVVVRAG